MASRNPKSHLLAFGVVSILAGLILLCVYLGVGMLLTGIEEVGLQDSEFLGYAFMSGGWGFAAIVMIYALIQFGKGYLDQRTFQVPETCFECNERLYRDEVKVVGEEIVECPHCGVSLKVKKGW